MLRRTLVALIVVVAGALGAATAQAAPTATFTVTSNADVAQSSGAGTSCVTPTDSTAAGACTLRAAVQAANAVEGSVQINLQANTTYPLTIPSDDTIDASTGNLDIRNDITIVGAGPTSTYIDGCGDVTTNTLCQVIYSARTADTVEGPTFFEGDRVFRVWSDDSLSLSGLTVEHGGASTAAVSGVRKAVGGVQTACTTDYDGGGILDDGGDVNLTNVTVTGNIAYGDGGGIEVTDGGTLEVYRSTFSDNSACPASIATTNGYGDGGAVNIDGSADTAQPVTIDSSTFTGNYADEDGGAVHDGAETAGPYIVNSTFTGNDAGDTAGALYEGGETTTLLNDTIDANTADGSGSCGFYGSCGGNLDSCGDCTSGFTLANTIVAGGTVPEERQPTTSATRPALSSTVAMNCGSNGSYTSVGYNLFDDTTDPCASAAIATDLTGMNPDLGALANNGGPTQTMALLTGSPAIDQIPVTACGQRDYAQSLSSLGPASNGLAPLLVDQRGVTRPQNSRCDIGAFEADTDMQVTSSPSSSSVPVGTEDTVTDTITNNGATNGSNVVLTDPGAGFTIISATPSQGTCTISSPTTVSCQLGTIAPGASATVELVIDPTSAGTITLTANVGANETDPNLTNNSATTTITVTPAGQIQVLASQPCVSVRNFPIHIQNVKQFGIYKAKVYLDGRLNKTLTGRALTATVDLKKLPFGTFTVKITAWTHRHGVIRYERVYHTCRLHPLPGHKHLLLGVRGG